MVNELDKNTNAKDDIEDVGEFFSIRKSNLTD